MPEKNNSQTITGNRKEITVVVNIGGATPAPLPGTGQPIAVVTTAASNVGSVHGTISGVVFNNPS